MLRIIIGSCISIFIKSQMKKTSDVEILFLFKIYFLSKTSIPIPSKGNPLKI